MGFIHASRADQLAATYARFYSDVADVLQLTIDPSQIAVTVAGLILCPTGRPSPISTAPCRCTPSPMFAPYPPIEVMAQTTLEQLEQQARQRGLVRACR